MIPDNGLLEAYKVLAELREQGYRVTTRGRFGLRVEPLPPDDICVTLADLSPEIMHLLAVQSSGALLALSADSSLV